MLNDICLHPDASKTSVLVWLDLCAAFDLVDHHTFLGRLERWFGLSTIVLNLWGPVLVHLLYLSCRWCWWLLKPLHQGPIWDTSGKSPASNRWISRVVDESWTDLFSFVSLCLLIVFCLFSSRWFFPNVDSIFFFWLHAVNSPVVVCCVVGLVFQLVLPVIWLSILC